MPHHKQNWWKLVDWDEAEDMAYFFSNDRLNPKSKKTPIRDTKVPKSKPSEEEEEEKKSEQTTPEPETPKQTTPTQEL